MLATTQWPLERAAHLTTLAWVCVLWLPESLMDLSALLLNNAKLWCFVLISLDKLLSKQLSCRGQWCPCDTTTIPYNHITLHIWHNMQHVHKFMCIVKGIKNGWPCIVEIRGTQGCALASRRRVQGRSQGTTLSASDLHNARSTILNPFYNMEY